MFAARTGLTQGIGTQATVEPLESRQMLAATAIEGKPWEYSVAFGDHAPGEASPSDFKVEIRWGDGTSTISRRIERIPGTKAYRAYATHTYRDAGPLKFDSGTTITNLKAGVTWNQGGVFPGLRDAPVHVKTFDVVVDDSRKYDGVFATFESECAYDTADEFRARIYTDGRVFDGKVTGGGGQFTVSGDHEFSSARKFNLKVVVIDEDGSNDGDDGSANVAKDDAKTIEKLGSKLVQQQWIQDWGHRLGLTAGEIKNTVVDAVVSFAKGLTDPNAKPSRISISDPDKYPFSRSFFDAGRMLAGIGKGVDDLINAGKFIIDHPDVLSPQFAQKLAAQATKWAIDNAPNAMNVIYKGFAGLENVDPATLGGRTIPTTVLGGMIFKGGGELIKKLPRSFRAGLKPMYLAGGAEIFAAGSSTFRIFGRPAGANVQWLLNAVREVNSGKFTTNCVNVARVLEEKLSGKVKVDFSALPSETQTLEVLEDAFGGSFTKTSRQAIEQALSANGSRGIIALSSPQLELINGKWIWSPGHVINVVNQGGKIWYIDGQQGYAIAAGSPEVQKLFSGYLNTMRLLQTH